MDVRSFAEWAHGGQRYVLPVKGDHVPFIKHLDMVMDWVAPLYSVTWEYELARALVYLHDVVEDTPVTVAFVREHFGDKIADGVDLLTDPPGKTREEQKAKLHARLGRLNEKGELERAVLRVKTCDRLCNINCAVEARSPYMRTYLREKDEFYKAVYRPDLCDKVWEMMWSNLSYAWSVRHEFGWDDEKEGTVFKPGWGND